MSKSKKPVAAVATVKPTKAAKPAKKAAKPVALKGRETQMHANGAAFTAERPGVLAVIVDTLRKANAKRAVTKSDILDVLCETFPERDRAKMKSTVSMQVPSGLRFEKEITVSKTEAGGYYIK